MPKRNSFGLMAQTNGSMGMGHSPAHAGGVFPGNMMANPNMGKGRGMMPYMRQEVTLPGGMIIMGLSIDEMIECLNDDAAKIFDSLALDEKLEYLAKYEQDIQGSLQQWMANNWKYAMKEAIDTIGIENELVSKEFAKKYNGRIIEANGFEFE